MQIKFYLPKKKREAIINLWFLGPKIETTTVVKTLPSEKYCTRVHENIADVAIINWFHLFISTQNQLYEWVYVCLPTKTKSKTFCVHCILLIVCLITNIKNIYIHLFIYIFKII